MQETSDLYKVLLAELQAGNNNIRCENRLAIGSSGTLIDRTGNHITFGGNRILVDSGGPEGGYGEDMLLEGGLLTKVSVFPNSTPTVGACISGEIEVDMLLPASEIPKRARLVPYVRLTDGIRSSEWIQKGVFFTDNREKSPHQTFETISLHGYDAMLKGNADYPPSTLIWPAKDIDVVREIAAYMDIPVDERTVAGIDRGYDVNYPAGYSCLETLGFIASMYAGCFVMSDMGELLLIRLDALPQETRYLIDETGNSITFGGVRILV